MAMVSSIPEVEELYRSLSLKEEIKVQLGFRVSIGKFKKPYWPGEAEFFIFKCHHGKLAIDYPHGKNHLSCEH